GVTLANADGQTVDGLPFRVVKTPGLEAGQTLSPVVLEFSDPTLTPFVYSTQTIDGPGGPAAPDTAGVLDVTNSSFRATEGAAFTGTVATFTDSDGDPASNYAATISWGEGAVSAGTVTAANTGHYVVTGTHTYAEEGNYSFSVRVQDVDGSSAAATG